MSSPMVVYERAVRFEEVDAAGIAFFGNFFGWCHEAMERFFDPIPGGYVDLITRRGIGFPAVHITSDWKAPLRYGDRMRIETSVLHVGTTSVRFRYVVFRLASPSLSAPPLASLATSASRPETHAATIEHVCVCSVIKTLAKVPLPDDCRALLEAHRADAGDSAVRRDGR